MSSRAWVDGLSRLDIERDPDGSLRFAVHAVDCHGEVVHYGYGAEFRGADVAEIAEFIREDV